MTFVQFKTHIASFSSNRANLDSIENLVGKTNISMKQVCRDAVPTVLVKNANSNRKIFRRLDQKAFICYPREVTTTTLDIEMDESLLDAVALHLLSGIETARAPAYMKMYWNIIDNHEQMLLNSDLALNMLIPEDLVNDDGQIIIRREDYDEYLKANTITTESGASL